MDHGAWDPWALLAVIVSEPHRDPKRLGRPFELADFHPYLQGGSSRAGGVPLDGAMAARLGDLFEARKEQRGTK